MSSYNNEQQIRKWVRRILVESIAQQRLDEYRRLSRDEFSSIFYEPFKDVFKTAKVAFKDVLTSAKFAFDILVTISPKKLHELRKNYHERKKRLRKEYAEVLKPSMDVLGDDLKLAAFLFNPVAMIGATAVAKGVSSTPDAIDFFKEAGFFSPSKREKEESGGKIKEPRGIISTAFNALRKLFFMGPLEEAYLPLGLILSEQDKEDAEQQSLGNADVQSVVAGVMDEYGILDQTSTAAQELSVIVSESVDALMAEVVPSMEIMTKIETATSLEEFTQAMEEAKQQGLDLGGASPQSLQADLENEVDQLLQDEKFVDKFVRQLLDQKGTPAPKDEPLPELGQEEIRDELAQKLFVNASDSIREGIVESKEALIEQALAEIAKLEEEFEIDDEVRKIASGTSAGVEFLNIFEEAKQTLTA